MWSILRSQKGFSMVESMIALAILGATAVFVVNMSSQETDKEKELNVRQTLLRLRSTLIQTLRSPDAISNTAKTNALTCLENNSGCSAHDYTPISLVDGVGIMYTDKSNTALGVNQFGKACTTFPSKACPFRYTIKLKTICSDPACLVPQFKFLGELNLDSSINSIAVKNFEFEITGGQAIDSYERSCNSLGGIYQPGTPPSCLLPMAGDCPLAPDGTFQAVVGYNEVAQQKICKPIFKDFLNGISCSRGEACSATNPTGTPGQVMVGIRDNGDPICVPVRLNDGCETLCDTSPACISFNCQRDPSPPECNPPADPASFNPDGGCGAGGC